MRVWRYFYLLAFVAAFLSGAKEGEAQQKPLQQPLIRAASAILVEDATGAVLFAKEPDKQLPPASTTKIVTGMLLAREVPPDTPIPVSPQAASTPGHRLGVRAGDRLPARDMLYAVMLLSANDASEAVAEQMDGTQARFADRMNQEAVRNGATRSHFVNPHGLPAPGHVSTVRDLATLARAALRIPAFAAVVRTPSYRLSAPNGHLPAVLNNQDPLLGTFPGSDGVKTGYTQEAGYCYVGSATRNGRRLVVALLHSPDWQGEARQLLEYGFTRPAASSPTTPNPNASQSSKRDPSAAAPTGPASTEKPVGSGALATSTPLSGAGGQAGGSGSPLPPPGFRGAAPSSGAVLPLSGVPTDPQTHLSSEKGSGHKEQIAGQPSAQDRKKQGASTVGAIHAGNGLPEPSPARSLWWLWLLLLLLLLLLAMRRKLAQWGENIMNRLRTAFSDLMRRSTSPRMVRRTPQTVAVPVRTIEAEPPAYRFSEPCVPRRPGNGWLAKLLEAPSRLLEPAVRRQAAAILDANPQLCSDRLLSLLSSNTVKVRLAACQLVASAFPRRSEETLMAIIEEERTPSDVRQDAAEMLARTSGDRHEPAWRQMLLRDGSPAAAHALALQPRLDNTTQETLRRFLNTSAPEKTMDEATRRNANLRTGNIVSVLAKHDALPEAEADSLLRALPAAQREQAVTQTLHGVTSPWATRQLMEVVLRGHAYPALQALMEDSPRLIRAALEELDDPTDTELHTRARIARWLLLKEGTTREIQELAQEGNDLAANALNLAHLHHWQPAQASPDALLAAAQIVSLRMGFSDHAPEQIARAFRKAATGEASPEQMAQAPELQPLAEAYTNPEVYDAVQAALHSEDGLNALLAEIARHPERPLYAKELAFWSDKTSREARVQIAQALAHTSDAEASEALMERAVDGCPTVRSAAQRALLNHVEVGVKAPAEDKMPEASPAVDPEPQTLDQAA